MLFVLSSLFSASKFLKDFTKCQQSLNESKSIIFKWNSLEISCMLRRSTFAIILYQNKSFMFEIIFDNSQWIFSILDFCLVYMRAVARFYISA